MRKYYRRIRELTLALAVRTCGEDSISEENAGLHFLMDIPADSGFPEYSLNAVCGLRRLTNTTMKAPRRLIQPLADSW